MAIFKGNHEPLIWSKNMEEIVIFWLEVFLFSLRFSVDPYSPYKDIANENEQ